ncbi:MAG: hypothetical protein DMF69_12390 [Acidobacteria bacterium]|nr:MAG: hypothetical protein DMF69_12390 [Acidobacteriota bacterium]
MVILLGTMNSKKDEKKSKAEKPTEDESCTETDSKQILKPVRPKIGESSDNLKQRAEWYQKRTGK